MILFGHVNKSYQHHTDRKLLIYVSRNKFSLIQSLTKRKNFQNVIQHVEKFPFLEHYLIHFKN